MEAINVLYNRNPEVSPGAIIEALECSALRGCPVPQRFAQVSHVGVLLLR